MPPDNPVHDFMSSVHVIFGLPQVWEPAVVPCIMSFSKQSPFFLSMCSLYASFLSFTDAGRLFDTPAVSTLEYSADLIYTGSSGRFLPVTDVVGRQHLRSATQQMMVVPRHRLSTVGTKHSPCKAPWSGTPCRMTSVHSRTMSPLDSA